MLKKIIGSSMLVAFVATATLPLATQVAAAEQQQQKKKKKTKIVGQSVGKKVQKAFEAYSEDRIDDALAILLDIETTKEYDRAYVDRFIANMYATKGGDANSVKAIEYLEKATKDDVLNDKEHSDSIKLLADLQIQQKMYREALTNYDAWMKYTGEEDANTYVKIAQAHYELKELDKMIEPADKAIALYEEPNQNPYILKLTSFYERKKYPESVKVLEDVLQLFPENKTWWTQLGMFYTLVEDYDRALYTLDLAYKQGFLEKESEIKMLANLYANNDVPIKSAKLMEKYIDNGLIPRTSENMFTMANSFHAAQEVKTAAKYFGDTAKLSNDPKHYRRQGMLLQQSEQYDAATKALQKAIDLDIDNKGAVYMTMAEAYFYQEKFKQAYAAIKKAQEDPKSRRAARSWAQYIKDTADRKNVKI
ncbi:tetratricopeptide repeat protein [Thalassotalea sp. PS06]|uniref:tetratricopeptide repeat protein n=1 Tax=Thalassotalea sp. PS06 TaxID=2594005 RepID=UPI0011635A92|nr:tetratricopeptide repeat protein [Thalassotalea sp. PS06]QDP00642.1 tetratricopeptide repeat protein [Thalassotalea sp. PS06]